MIKGVSLTLAGTEYIVPPISLGSLEVLQDRITGFDGSVNAANVKTVIDCLHAALKRNYPDMTREKVADMVDISTFGDVMAAVMGVSGQTRASGSEQGKAAAPLAGAASTPE